MPRPPLPLECVLTILDFLSEEYDTDTMARLLCVNRTICAAVLPFLYGDCLNITMHNHRPRFKKTTSVTISQLIRTLLNQTHPQDQIPEILRVAYLSQNQDDLQSTAEQPTPVFKYGRFIRKMVPHGDLRRYLLDVRRNPRVMDYATAHRLYDKYFTEGLIIDNRDYNRDTNLVSALQIDIYRQLIWTLCQGNRDSIEELSIPLRDIERYIDHADQFKSLSKVIFTVQKIAEPLYDLPYFSQEEFDRSSYELEDRRDRLFLAMVQFVKQHNSVHQNLLRQVFVPDSYDLPETSRYSTDSVWSEILSLLPPLHNPRVINRDNLCRLAARLSDTNLSHVESIILNHLGWATNEEKTLTELGNIQPPFLSRCRALKHLEMRTLGPDMFQWAVLEKKQQDAEQQQQGIVGRQSSSWQHDLVRLRSVIITHKAALKPVEELNDIAFAFGDSLEELSARVKWGQMGIASNDLGSSSRVVYGRNWNLPRLRILDLEERCLELHFDLDSLQRCRNLQHLRLTDKVTTYNHRDVRSWSSVNLPHLKSLNLVGSPALFFNMDSLHHSPCLEVLNLETTTSGIAWYIPPPEDLEREDVDDLLDTITHHSGLHGTPSLSQGPYSIVRRSRYTWDWHLPCLSNLDLKAVFAYKFEFQWLQYLPNLHSLHLNTSSTYHGLHERSVTLEDLQRRPQQQEDEDEGQSSSDRYFSLPKIESFNISGHWMIDSKVLEVLCLIVAPNLREICFGVDCAGHTVQEWVTLARKMPRLEHSTLERRFTDNEIKKAELLSFHGLRVKYGSKKLLKYTISGRQFWDLQSA
ncbi:hypothetical protein BGX34_007381 [Mortierella sp. NVP85]|nr:hypothetical protein BGX34_007381 [Mortierella sp. NVP85]